MIFKVVLENNKNLTFNVKENENILDAALKNGLNLSYGCRNAVCGACSAKLLSGEVDYGDALPLALTSEDEANNVILLCQAKPVSDLVIDAQLISGISSVQISTFPCKIISMEVLAADVMKLLLKLPESKRLLFFAGQYIDILLKDGRRRSFSIANAPHDDQFLEFHIRHVPDGEFTGKIFDQLKVNDLLRIEGPLGNFFFREDSPRPIIFMAGGTGFAPIKGIIEHALREGVRNKMVLYWGARQSKDLYQNSLAENWAKELPNFEYIPVLSDSNVDQGWKGQTGFVHEAIEKDYPDMAGFDIYAAGPPVMVNAGKRAFIKNGLPAERYFSDSFDYASDKLPKA